MNRLFSTVEAPPSAAEADAGPTRVGEIMTRSPLVVREDATLAEVARLLLAPGSGAALVVDREGRLRGIITEDDFTCRERWLTGTSERARHLLGEWQVRSNVKEICATGGLRRVADLMRRDVPTAREEELTTDVVARMIHHELSHLPVERAGRLVGIITRRDVLQLIAGQPAATPAPTMMHWEG
jgi:CBS domain-containing protein